VMAEGEKDCFQVYLSPEGGEGCALLPGESALSAPLECPSGILEHPVSSPEYP
jgi:hypothetical protein